MKQEICGKIRKCGATLSSNPRRNDKPKVEDDHKKRGFLIRSKFGPIQNQKSNSHNCTKCKI